MTILADIYRQTMKFVIPTKKSPKEFEAHNCHFEDLETGVVRTGMRHMRQPSEAEKNEVTLANIKLLLKQDKNVLTRHPALKHLLARYDAVVNDVTAFGHPVARIEPIRELVDRVNTLTEERHNKDQIKKKAYQSRSRPKENYDRSNRRR